MTTHTATTHAPFALPGSSGRRGDAAGRNASGGIATLPGRLLAGVRRYLAERAAIAELSALSDYQLADIGVGRSDIVRAVTTIEFAGRC